MKSFASAAVSMKCFCAMYVVARWVRPRDCMKQWMDTILDCIVFCAKDGRRHAASPTTILFVTGIPYSQTWKLKVFSWGSIPLSKLGWPWWMLHKVPFVLNDTNFLPSLMQSTFAINFFQWR
jgi:hypothetical protein